MERTISYFKHLRQKINQTRLTGFWAGFLVGFPYFGYVFLWMWSAHPLRTLGIDSTAGSAVMVGIFHLGATAVSAAGGGLFGSFLLRLSKGSHRPSLVPLFAAAGFTLFEYARSWSLSFAPLGQGSVLGPHWTFGNIAYWFSGFSPLRLSASVWGIYGVVFLVSLAVASLAVWYRQRRAPAVALWVLVFLLAITAGTFILTSRAPAVSLKSIPVVIVQTEQISRPEQTADALLEDLGAKLKLIDQLPGQAASGSFVVLPEGASLFKELSSFLDSAGLKKYLNHFASARMTLLDNAQVVQDGRSRSRTIALDPLTNDSDYYDKNLLSPGGEFMPYWVRWPARLFGFARSPQIEALRAFAPGDKSNTIELDGQKFGVIICSEAISPQYARKISGGFIIAQNSLGIFSGSDLIGGPLLAMARYRAAENGKYIVWSSNFGRSFIIDGLGNIKNMAPSGGYQILTGDIVPNTSATWYNKLGDWPILSLSLLLVGWSLKKRKG